MPTLPAPRRALVLFAATLLCACRVAMIGERAARFAQRNGSRSNLHRSVRSWGVLWALVFAGLVAARAGTFGDFIYDDYGAFVSIHEYTGAGGDVVIPAEIPVTVMVDGNPVTTLKPVTAIGAAAFRDRTSLTGLTIPNSVTSIGDWAFVGCSGLTGKLTIPDGVDSIGNGAFYNCSGLTGNLTIPNRVTSIGYSAFSGCSGLTGILTIGSNVTWIGNGAFSRCSGLTGNLTIPDSVASIENYAFSGCVGLTGNLTIGNSVTSIGGWAFSECSGLTGDLVIPNSVALIGDFAFSVCSGLTGDLVIPNSVTWIGNGAFNRCSGLTGNLTIGNSVNSIGDHAFSGCSGLTGELTIPNNVTSIGGRAFQNCSGLTGSLVIGNGVTSIGDQAFLYCSGLTGSLVIGNGVTSIGDQAFLNCSGLKGNLTIGSGVTSIGVQAFQNCGGLKGNLTIPSSVTAIEDYAFYECPFDYVSFLGDAPSTFGRNVFFGASSSFTVYYSSSSFGFTSPTWQGYNTQPWPDSLVISEQPSSDSIFSGQTATLSVMVPVPNYRPLTYQWYRGASGSTEDPVDGAVDAIFTTPVLTTTTSYWVRVTGPLGSVDSASATVTVYPPLVLSRQPGLITATSGADASFEVAATGAGLVRYQWRRSGTPLAGATLPTLTLPAVTMADAGFYDVVVSDDFSVVTSAPGRLEVAPPDYGTIFRADPGFTCLLERDGADISQVAVTESGAVYVAGTFTRLNGVRCDGFARLNPDSTVDPTFAASINHQVAAIQALPGTGGILVGGTFTQFGGSSCAGGLARISADGVTLDPAFGAALGLGSVRMLRVQADGKILVVGSATAFGHGAMFRLDADGALDSTWAPLGSGLGLAGITGFAAQPDGKVVVVGTLIYNGTSLGRIARLNTDGTVDATFVPGTGFNAAPAAVAIQSDGKIVVLGTFITYQGVASKGLARLNPDGSLDSSLVTGSGFSGTTNFSGQSLLLQPDGALVIGGQFSGFNGTAYPNLIRLSPAGVPDPTFAAGAAPNGRVAAVAYDPVQSQIVAAGAFTAVGASPSAGLARYTLGGAVATVTGGGRVAATVNAAVPTRGGRWVIGGDFNYVNGLPRNRIAGIQTDGTIDATFAVGAGFDNAVLALVRTGADQIVAGGQFTTFDGTARSGIARLNVDGSNDASFNIGAGFTPAAVGYLAVMADGRLVAGGDFGQFNGATDRCLVRLRADGTRDPSFNNSLINQISWVGMEVDPFGRILVGSWWLGYGNGMLARSGTFRFNVDGPLDETFNGGRGPSRLNSPATAFAAQIDGRFVAAGYFTRYDGVPRQNLARFNADGSMDWSFASGSGGQGIPMSLSLLPDGRVLAAGSLGAAGKSRGTVRYSADGALDDTFLTYDMVRVMSAWRSGSRPSYTDDGRILAPGVTTARDGVWHYGLTLLKPDADPRPAITLQPANRTATVGAAALFTVTATGGPLTYQWFKDGVAIAGATSATLSLPVVAAGDFGVYAVTVANSFGSVTSSPALLGVGGIAGSSYRLADYYYPLAAGNTWLHESPTDPTVRTRITIGAVQTINSYTGRTTPVATAVAAMPVQSIHGSYVGGVFTPNEDWADFISFEAGRLCFLGNDEDGGASQTRAGSGLEFPASLPVGGSAVMEQDLYQDGAWVGGIGAGIRLLGVESVTVPAGTFTGCLHLQIVFARADGVQTNEEWWAPGIGMVKHLRAEDNWDDRQLLSYAVVPAVQIATPPVGTSIGSGGSTTLNVAATGLAPLAYQWYEGDSGDTSRPVAGATDATFNTAALTAWARYWVRVSSLAGSSDSPTTLVEVTGGTMTVADWTAQGQGTPEGTLPADQRAPLAAPAGDGVTNLMKFALGVPPLDNAEAHLPEMVKVTDAGVPVALALDFAVNPHAQGIRYVLEVSDNCVTWTEAASILDPLGSNPDGTELVRLREKAPPAAIRRFARLKVEMVAP